MLHLTLHFATKTYHLDEILERLTTCHPHSSELITVSAYLSDSKHNILCIKEMILHYT